MQKLIHTILKAVFPERCLDCRAKNKGLICPDCLKKIPYFYDNSDEILGAAFYGSDLIRKAVWLLKYKRVKKLAEPLAELIFQRIFAISPKLPRLNLVASRLNLGTTIIIPIPLSKKRLRQRGFNQAELIAKALSDKTSILMDNKILEKTKHTETQVQAKTRQNRLENLKGTFKVLNPDKTKNKTILLIDDVSTTGATIFEASRILKKSRAKKVIPIVVAKT